MKATLKLSNDPPPVNPFSAAEGVLAAMRSAGIEPPPAIVPDGILHRFHVAGDRAASRNGWYVFHPDPPVSAAFGCWKRGVCSTWTAVKPEALSRADRIELRRRADEGRRARLEEQNRRHEGARARAIGMWKRSDPASENHPYLVRKQVAPGIARQRDDRLLLPVLDLQGRLWSLQFIDGDGSKLLLAGGRKKGNFIPVAGKMPGASRILICEGWATGGTLAQMEPGALVLAAIDAGNLTPVAVAVRARWPQAEIVVCCDADEVGMRKGRAAAIAAGASVAVPRFPEGCHGSDWNDLAVALRKVA